MWPLVWKQGNASYVHERMVGTPQALLMKSIVSVLLVRDWARASGVGSDGEELLGSESVSE